MNEGASPLCLAFDTTGHGGSVALAEGGRLLVRVDHDAARGYAEELFGLIDTALDRAQREAGSITRVAVVSGPGSFTGLRIGVMSAKSLAHALGLELWEAPTLDLVGHSDEGQTHAAADAGRGHVWSRSPRAPEVERLTHAELLARLAAGELLRVREASLAETLRGLDGDARIEVAAPLAETLARVASLGLGPAARADVAAFVPRYAGLSQAERVHGLDLSDEVNAPIPPEPWN